MRMAIGLAQFINGALLVLLVQSGDMVGIWMSIAAAFFAIVYLSE